MRKRKKRKRNKTKKREREREAGIANKMSENPKPMNPCPPNRINHAPARNHSLRWLLLQSHSLTGSLNQPSKQASKQSIKQSNNQAIKQSSNQAIHALSWLACWLVGWLVGWLFLTADGRTEHKLVRVLYDTSAAQAIVAKVYCKACSVVQFNSTSRSPQTPHPTGDTSLQPLQN